MVNIKQVVWEAIKGYIFYLRHVSNVAAHFQKKNKRFIYLFNHRNEESQESGKY